jgi:hypothetical protein
MRSLSDLAHHSNDHHARGRHSPNKEINHKVNYKNAKFRPVQLVRKFKKCCLDFSCEGCEKIKRKEMKLCQVKAISISPLHYKQTGTVTLRWPPPNNLESNSVSLPDSAYRQGVCHFLVTGKETNIAERKGFSPEHVDGPVIDKSNDTFENDTFEDKDGNVWAFIPGESTSASEMEKMAYYGTASDNALSNEPQKRSVRRALKETKEGKAKLEEEMRIMKEEREKEKLYEEEKAKTVQFLSHKLKVDKDGNNLLHQAALKGKTQNLIVFLENKLFDLEAKNNLGETALHCALKNQAVLQNGITDVTMLLESDCFDLEAKTKWNELSEILCVKNVGAFVVCAFLMK